MSTHVIGLRDENDPQYKKMKAALLALGEAGIEKLPAELAKHFGDEYADDPEDVLTVKIPHKEWGDGDMSTGIEVVVSEIPKGVKKIRFVNSW